MRKTFDCVEMKHRGSAKIRQKLSGMSVEDQAAYWRERTQAAHRRRLDLEKKHPRQDLGLIRRKWFTDAEMNPPKKDFDCVDVMHRGGEHVRRKLEGKGREKTIAFWTRESADSRQEHQATRVSATRGEKRD